MAEVRSLRPLGGWDLVSRGRFEARHDGHLWTVDLDYFDFGEKLHLYGETTMLAPVDGTAEAWRLQLERDRPVLSRRIGAVSWAALAAAAVERALRFKSNRCLG